MQHLNFTKQLLLKEKRRQQIETLKVVGYMVAETLTAISIFVFAYLYFKYV